MADNRPKAEGEYLQYQGKPLVREGNTIIYGDFNHDPFALVLEILTYSEGALSAPKDVLVQIVDTKNPNNIVKQDKETGLEAAFSLGLIWLDMELKKADK